MKNILIIATISILSLTGCTTKEVNNLHSMSLNFIEEGGDTVTVSDDLRDGHIGFNIYEWHRGKHNKLVDSIKELNKIIAILKQYSRGDAVMNAIIKDTAEINGCHPCIICVDTIEYLKAARLGARHIVYKDRIIK
jgi:hypothetical protein